MVAPGDHPRAVVAVGLVVAGFWIQRKRHERFFAWAVRHGWTYTHADRSLVSISRGQPFNVGDSQARHRGAARHVRVPAGALVHVPVDHRHREAPDHAARARRRAGPAGLPAHRGGDARGSRCAAGQAGRCAGHAARVGGVQPRVPGGGVGSPGRARDPAPATDGAAPAGRRARQRVAHRRHVDPVLGAGHHRPRPAGPPAGPARRPSCGPSRGTSGRTTGTTRHRPPSRRPRPTLRSPDLPHR